MRQTLLLGLIAATVSLPAFASHDDRDDNYEDRARVISVTPQLERVNTPRQECRTEYVRESVYENRGRSPGGAIIGGNDDGRFDEICSGQELADDVYHGVLDRLFGNN